MTRRIIFILIMIISTQLLKAQDMYIMGYDAEHEYYGVFLGKITAADDDDDSIWNTAGAYGSNTSATSIWNTRGPYGSPDGNCSPFNEDAVFPPKIYDEEKNFYGYFTVSDSRPQRCTYDIINVICTYHNNISADVKLWYTKLFE